MNEYTNFNNGNDNRNILSRCQPEALRANMAFVEVITEFGRPRSMTPAQVYLAWLLAKGAWIAPISGTTKLAHMGENLRSRDFAMDDSDVDELEGALARVAVVGDRYPAEQQRQVGQ